MNILLKYRTSRKAKVPIYYENTSKIGCKKAQLKRCKHCKKIALELSENSTKIGRKSIKTVQKQVWNTTRIHDIKWIQNSRKLPQKGKIYLSEITPHSPRLGFHANDLLTDSFTLTFLRILGKFLRNFSEMLKSIFGFEG